MHDLPAWLVRTLTAVTSALAKMRRRLIPPALAALDMGTMSWIAQALSAFCELGLPQALSGTPRTAAELAAGGYGDEAMLFRLLRALCAYDVVHYAGAGRFTLGHVGKGLTGEHSAAPMIRYANAPWHVKAYAQLARGIRTGRPGFDLSENMSMFEYFSQNEDAGEIFDHAMQALTPMFAAPMAQAYDFSPFTSVVDVGGGTGALLAAILTRFPSVCGIVFERSSVAQRARERANTLALSQRLRAVEGDMFLDAPPVADAYIVSHILHDWSDADCVLILRNIRGAMPDGARLLVYEIVALPPNNRWSQDRIQDLEMLAMLTGRERTREEYAALFAQSGLRLSRVIPTAAAESIIEALPLSP